MIGDRVRTVLARWVDLLIVLLVVVLVVVVLFGTGVLGPAVDPNTISPRVPI